MIKPKEGLILVPNAGIAEDFRKPILTLVRKMADETKRELKSLFEHPDYALDGDPGSQSRILINRLLKKYDPLFAKWAKKSVDRMISRTMKYSMSTISKSLESAGLEMEKRIKGSMVMTRKDVAEQLKIDLSTERLKEVVTASTNEAVMLIRTIPKDYLSEVQGAVMRSITTGNGLADLVPFLNEKYGQNIRKARNVANDQARKAYANINATRLKNAGVKKFIWIHSHGGQHPRKLHEELDGKVCEFDDPPYIGDMYGKAVYGLPAQLPNCRCSLRPLLSFGNEENE